MKTACVTGATGCVGRNLVEELLKRDWTVTVLHRKSSDLTRLEGCAVRFQEVDLHEFESVRNGIPPGVDAVFHVAGNTSHWAAEAEQQWKDNVLATRHLVQASLERKVGRMIFTSTGATLSYQNLDQRDSGRIRNGYIRTKRLAELEVYGGIQRGLDAVVLHPIIVIGAYDRNSYAQIFQNMRNSGFRACFPGRITFCHAADVARAHVHAYERGRRGEHYVLGGTHATWFEAFRVICQCVGVGNPVVVPKAILTVVSHFMALAAKVTRRKPLLTPDLIRLLDDAPDVTEFEKWKAREELGYRSRSLSVMIADCHKWLVEQRLVEGSPAPGPVANVRAETGGAQVNKTPARQQIEGL